MPYRFVPPVSNCGACNKSELTAMATSSPGQMIPHCRSDLRVANSIAKADNKSHRHMTRRLK